jgi:hypothetical protein
VNFCALCLLIDDLSKLKEVFQHLLNDIEHCKNHLGGIEDFSDCLYMQSQLLQVTDCIHSLEIYKECDYSIQWLKNISANMDF